MFKRNALVIVMVGVMVLTCASFVYAAEADLQKQLDDIKGTIPKFAIPMREVGDRFQNMYFAAKEGNWGLAAYMSKYMNNAMKPASLTKPVEYGEWKSFYDKSFAPVNKAIQAQDWKAFEKEYTSVISTCNACHVAMGYAFIEVIKTKTPADTGFKYSLKSKATDVPAAPPAHGEKVAPQAPPATPAPSTPPEHPKQEHPK
jgi:hypothetical protein